MQIQNLKKLSDGSVIIILKFTVMFQDTVNVFFLEILPKVSTISTFQILCQSKLDEVKFAQNKNSILLMVF